MIEQPRRRPPLPIVAVALTTALVAVAVLVSAMASSGSSRIIGSMTALLVLGLAYGLWRGSGPGSLLGKRLRDRQRRLRRRAALRRRRVGLPVRRLGGLRGTVAVPASSREWFHAPSAP
ncbi:hypothetical protein [Micromonospora endolithica]|uniref:hypothetical protein n=1 Tax=Micromonospora endolithica TaxID=230091 RepID=UPI0011BDC670|nr:hypothetical protein [Micromonospora endolithica]